MDTLFGLFGLVVYVALTISLAAAITWAVVRITPSGDSKKTEKPA